MGTRYSEPIEGRCCGLLGCDNLLAESRRRNTAQYCSPQHKRKAQKLREKQRRAEEGRSWDQVWIPARQKQICPSCGEHKHPHAKVCLKCWRGSQRGPFHANWTGGRHVDVHGYVLIWQAYHPKITGKKHSYVKEHVLVMEEVLGRYLYPDETVHHKNGVKADNRPENLELWTKSHPSGQRVEDVVAWAEEILRRYDESALSNV